MQTFISDLIPKLQQFSKRLDDLTMLTNQHWVVVDEIDKVKTVYIFRANKELLISSNGQVEKGSWDYLGNNSLLIDRKDSSHLFKHGFFDENILALKIDGKDEYAFLVNENKAIGDINTFAGVTDFLNRNYIDPKFKNAIEVKYEINDNTNIEKSFSPIPQLNENDGMQDSYNNTFNIILIVTISVMLLIFLFMVIQGK